MERQQLETRIRTRKEPPTLGERTATGQFGLPVNVKRISIDNQSERVATKTLPLSDPNICEVDQLRRQVKTEDKVTMVVEHKNAENPESQNIHEMDNSVGRNLRTVLKNAQAESRVVAGLSAAVKQLDMEPEETLFCVLAPPKKGDSATHMHEVLLQAFCLENDIYIIQVRVCKRRKL